MDQAQIETKAEIKNIKRYAPLYGIYIWAVALSFAVAYKFGAMDHMNVMYLFMGFILTIVGLVKLIEWKGFIEGFKKYDLIAKHFHFYAWVYPLIEVTLGTLYILGIGYFYLNLATFLAMSFTAVGTWLTLQEDNREIDCVCLGSLFGIPLGKLTLSENLFMAGMAVYMMMM